MLHNLLKSGAQSVRTFVNWLGGVTGISWDLIESAFDSFFGMILSFLWHPIRDFIAGPIGVLEVIEADLFGLPHALQSMIDKISHRFNTLTSYVIDNLNALTHLYNDLISGLPDLVLTWVVNGFLTIVEPIGDLLERYIVDHWDDAA